MGSFKFLAILYLGLNIYSAHARTVLDVNHKESTAQSISGEDTVPRDQLGRAKLMQTLAEDLKQWAAKNPDGSFRLSDKRVEEIKSEIKQSLKIPQDVKVSLLAKGTSALIGDTVLVGAGDKVYYINSVTGTAVPILRDDIVYDAIYEDTNGKSHIVTQIFDSTVEPGPGQNRYTVQRNRFLVNGEWTSYEKGVFMRDGMIRVTLKGDSDLTVSREKETNTIRVNNKIAPQIQWPK